MAVCWDIAEQVKDWSNSSLGIIVAKPIVFIEIGCGELLGAAIVTGEAY